MTSDKAQPSRPTLAVITVFCALLLLAGCGQRERPADTAAAQGILIWANGSEPVGIDPHVVTGVTENRIISTLIEGLINYHPYDDNLPEPGVAASWESNEDHSQWVFHLRPEARWSNGEPVTAHDFVYSWNRMLSPPFGAKYADMLHILRNGQAYHRGEIDDFSKVGVQALDDHTLAVELEGPTPFFLSMLKHYAWFPVHPPTIEKHGGRDSLANNWTRLEPVGNGPFVLLEWIPNQHLRVGRSPTYWDREVVQLKEVRFVPIDNANTEEAAFRNREIHVTNTVPPARLRYYQERHPELIRVEPYFGTYYYRFNTTRPPLDNRKVRKALTLSIDKEQIVEHITRGGQKPATGYTPPGIDGYSPLDKIHYNPERARELLAQAGFPGGADFPEMEILFNTLEAHRAIAEAIQNMWRENLGIRVRLVNQEWRVYIPSVQNMEYDIARAGWIGDYVDPITFLDMWTTGNGNNSTGWSSEEYDELIRTIQRTGDRQKRFEKLRQAENMMLSEYIIAPIYWYNSIYLLDPRIQGWNPKFLDNRPIKYISFKD